MRAVTRPPLTRVLQRICRPRAARSFTAEDRVPTIGLAPVTDPATGTKCGEATTGRIGEGEGTGLVQRQVERVPEPGSGAWISPTDAQPKPSSPGSARRQAVAGSARPKSPSVNHSRDWHIFLRRHLPSSQIFEINIKSPLHHSFSSKRYFNLKPNEGCQPESGS